MRREIRPAPYSRAADAVFAPPSLDPPPLDLNLRIAALDLGAGQTARRASARLRVDRGRLDLDDVTMELGGARAAGRLTMRRDAALAAVGLGFGVTVGLAITAETHSELVAPGGTMTFIGSVTGLVGMYLALVMVLFYRRFVLNLDRETFGVFTLFGILFFLLSVAMIGIGLIGEYVGRTYQVVRVRQRYFVREMIESKD